MNETAQKMPLLLPEYGRNVQKMVRWLFTIEDRDERSRQARLVVSTMSNVYPYKRDTDEFRHMVWDHLFMIAGDNLDIDSPFDKPEQDQFSPTPATLPYTQKYVVQKQYGSIVPRMAKEMIAIQDEEQRLRSATFLARYMRQKSYDYNNEFPSNDTIIADLYDMTSGVVRLEQSAFNGTQIECRVVNNVKKQIGGKSAQNQNQNNRLKNRKKVEHTGKQR